MVSYYPMKKNADQRIVFPILDADGDLVTGAAGLDSEHSIDGGGFIDCTNEATEIATGSGMYYLDLLAAETNGDVIAIIVKTTTSGAKTTALVFYPSAETLHEVDDKIDSIVAKLPTNYIMGSAVQTAKDDEIDAIVGYVDELESRLTAIRAGYLDNLSAGAVALASVCTEARLAELGAANIPADIDILLARLTAARAGYLDNLNTGVPLSAGAVDTIWDELTSGHFVAGSFGQRLQIVRSGTAQAGGANTITLDAGASAVNNFYINQTIFIVAGTGAGQSRKIVNYVGVTKVATVDSNWATQPDVASVFVIFPEYLADPWVAATRTLTALTGQPRTDLMGEDASFEAGTGARKARIDVAISSRSSHAAADIWAVATRALTDKANFSLSAAGIDAIIDDVIEGSLTLRQAIRLISSALFGKLSGGGTATLTFRDLGDTKARITATVDANKNRTAVTLDGA